MFKKSKALLILILSLLVVLAFAAVAMADDLSGHWSETYLRDAAARGWLSADENGNFRPEQPVTRGEFALMLWRALGSPQPKNPCPFTDITADAAYEQAATALFEMGVVTGVGNDQYAPQNTLTRETAFVMLARAFSLKPNGAGEAAEYTRFSDYTEISSWAGNAVSILLLKGYIDGVGNNRFAPKQALKQGELAKLLIGVYQGEQGAINTPAAPSNSLEITLKRVSSGSDSATVAVSVADSTYLSYIGWRTCIKDASFENVVGFTNITSAREFTVNKNGWYAVCAADTRDGFSYQLIEITNMSDGPALTLDYTPKERTYEVTVSVEEAWPIATYVGWRESFEGAGYSSEEGFTDISVDQKFKVNNNGWYAVCALDKDGRFGYRLIEITNANDGPVISTKMGYDGAGETTWATVNISASAKTGSVDFIAWRYCEPGDIFNSKEEFMKSASAKDITSDKSFTVRESGWYAICATDSNGNFSYIIIRIKN